MRNLRCYIPSEALMPDGNILLDPLYELADHARECTPGVTMTKGVADTGLVFEVPESQAPEFLRNLLDLCLFAQFRDEDKPNWAAALETVLEERGMGKTAAQAAVTEQEYKTLCSRLGGGFGDKLYNYLMNSTPENFWEAYTVADLDHRRKLADAANFLNEWGQKGREIAAEKHDAYLNRKPGDRRKWAIDPPGLIPMMQKFGFGLKQWADERKAKLEARPKPNPALDGGG